MEVAIVAIPGELKEGYQCPTCSKTYLMENPENGRPQSPPKSCDRCGSPMDVKEAVEYGEELARRDKTTINSGVGGRRTVKV